MTASCFRSTIGRLVALGTISTFVTFQYIVVKSKPQLSPYEIILQLFSCILLCNFLVVVARWADYEPIQGLKNNGRLPSINVIIPAYNESGFVRNSINSVLSSDYPRDKVHIIVVDDGSTDDTWSHIQHALPPKSSTLYTTIRHEVNRGKRQAMVTAFEVASNEILVTLDSDTILDKHTLRNLVSPFVLDSDVGGVAGHLSVFNIQSQGWDGFIPRILDCLFEQNGNIPRAAQSKHGFVTILPGAISAFRRDAILPHTKALVDTRFLGRPMRHGEDVQLTMGLLRDGWRLKYQSNAVGYTVAPETFLKAFLMYVRWERSNHTYWVLGLVRLAFRDAARFFTRCFARRCSSEPELLLPEDLEKHGGRREVNARTPDYHPMLMIFCAGFANFSYLSIVISWLRGFYFSPWVTFMNLGCLVVFATWFSTLLLADALHESEGDMAVEGDVKESDETRVLRTEEFRAGKEGERGSKVPGTVSFTFDDDSWIEKDEILTLFAQRNAQASFFLHSTPWTADSMKDNDRKSVVQTLHENGHLIGFSTSSRHPHSGVEHDDLLKARQKISTILGASSSSEGLRPQYIWSSPVDCTVQNGCVEKLTINGQRLVLWDGGPADMSNNTETTLLLDRLQAADPGRDSFLIPIRGSQKESNHSIGDLLDGFLQKGFQPVTITWDVRRLAWRLGAMA
ncbi:hypothetical protein Landi51_11837 [Colletotrichum acutatum]